MSKHNSYSLKYSAELSATLKADSLIPSGKRIPAAVNQVPHKLNFPIQHKWQADFSFSTNVECLFRAHVWVPLTPPMLRTVTSLTQTPWAHPNQAPRTLLSDDLKSHPISLCLMSSSLTWFHSRTTPGVWYQPHIIDYKKRSHWFHCFSVTKSWGRWQVVEIQEF